MDKKTNLLATLKDVDEVNDNISENVVTEKLTIGETDLTENQLKALLELLE